MATRLLTEMERAFGRKLSLSTLFGAATIERLAAVLHDPFSVHNPRVVPIQLDGSKPPFLCVGASPIFRALAQGPAGRPAFLGLDVRDGYVVRQPYRLEDFATSSRPDASANPTGRSIFSRGLV